MKENRINPLIQESRIVNFVKNLNKNLLLFFYNSETHNFFLKLNNFFKNIILRNANGSFFVKTARRKIEQFKLKDIGLFIILALLFNTAIMIILKREIDIFSAAIRIFFLILGIALFYRK